VETIVGILIAGLALLLFYAAQGLEKDKHFHKMSFIWTGILFLHLITYMIPGAGLCPR